MATAKKELSADTQATELHQDAEHTVYRLDGTRVSTRHLPAGLYIINGKKIIVK